MMVDMSGAIMCTRRRRNVKGISADFHRHPLAIANV